MSYLVLESLTKRFGRETVLEDASLAVEQGETVVVFGPSGCGKTVLLRLIAGIHEPDAGAIRIGDQTVTHLAPEDRDVGMAFQNFALYPHMSAFDNIASPLRARGLAAAEVSRRVEEVATLLKIEHVLGHLPRALSNGQKQRTSLARSLAPGPAGAAARRPLAQRRRQAALRDAPRAAARAPSLQRHRPLRHPGLQGGDGARPPGRRADGRPLRPGRPAGEALHPAGQPRRRPPVRRSDHQPLRGPCGERRARPVRHALRGAGARRSLPRRHPARSMSRSAWSSARARSRSSSMP